MRLLLVWLLNAIALLAVAYLIPGVAVDSLPSALVAALVLGLVNTVLRPILFVLTLPISVLTLGAFFLVLNGLLFWAVGSMLSGFHVSGFWSGVFGGIVYGLISWLLSYLIPSRERFE